MSDDVKEGAIQTSIPLMVAGCQSLWVELATSSVDVPLGKSHGALMSKSQKAKKPKRKKDLSGSRTREGMLVQIA